MKWPIWIPYPSSIIRSAFVIVFFFGVATFLFVSELLMIELEQLPTLEDIAEIESTVTGWIFLSFAALIIATAYVHHWFNGATDQTWMQKKHPLIPGCSSWGEGIYSAAGFSMALGVSANIYTQITLIFGLYPDPQKIVAFSTLVILAYFFHLGGILEKWEAQRKAIKIERQAAKKKAQADAQAARQAKKANAQAARQAKKADAQAARQAKEKKDT